MKIAPGKLSAEINIALQRYTEYNLTLCVPGNLADQRFVLILKLSHLLSHICGTHRTHSRVKIAPGKLSAEMNIALQRLESEFHFLALSFPQQGCYCGTGRTHSSVKIAPEKLSAEINLALKRYGKVNFIFWHYLFLSKVITAELAELIPV